MAVAIKPQSCALIFLLCGTLHGSWSFFCLFGRHGSRPGAWLILLSFSPLYPIMPVAGGLHLLLHYIFSLFPIFCFVLPHLSFGRKNNDEETVRPGLNNLARRGNTKKLHYHARNGSEFPFTGGGDGFLYGSLTVMHIGYRSIYFYMIHLLLLDLWRYRCLFAIRNRSLLTVAPRNGRGTS